VEFPRLDDGGATEALVLFVGSMGYRPNIQAVDLLVQEIWPAVRARVPAARLAVIGPCPELTASYHTADESVRFTGFVDDLHSWYARARVVCCPIRHGGGTRVKIIEAAAHAKAIVATRLAAEGLDFEDGREIVLRDAPARLAEACVRLLGDRHAAARLAAAEWRVETHLDVVLARSLADVIEHRYDMTPDTQSREGQLGVGRQPAGESPVKRQPLAGERRPLPPQLVQPVQVAECAVD